MEIFLQRKGRRIKAYWPIGLQRPPPPLLPSSYSNWGFKKNITNVYQYSRYIGIPNVLFTEIP